MAFPVHDWIRSAARFVWLTAVSAFGNPVTALAILVTSLLVFWADLSPVNWLRDYVPDLPSVAGLVNFSNIHSDLLELGCYVTAADVAASLVGSLLTVLTKIADFTVTFIPAALVAELSFVAIHSTLKFMERFKP